MAQCAEALLRSSKNSASKLDRNISTSDLAKGAKRTWLPCHSRVIIRSFRQIAFQSSKIKFKLFRLEEELILVDQSSTLESKLFKNRIASSFSFSSWQMEEMVVAQLLFNKLKCLRVTWWSMKFSPGSVSSVLETAMMLLFLIRWAQSEMNKVLSFRYNLKIFWVIKVLRQIKPLILLLWLLRI